MFNFKKSIVSVALISGFATFTVLPSTAMAVDVQDSEAYSVSHNGMTYHFDGKDQRPLRSEWLKPPQGG